jgi:glycolate oxidase subunit GlcD
LTCLYQHRILKKIPCLLKEASIMDNDLRTRLSHIVGSRYATDTPEDLLTYSYDASLSRGKPQVVVFPGNTEEVARIARLAHQEGIPLVPRGSGTNLSGGAVPIHGGIVMVLTRMNRILEIDTTNQRAVLEPGVMNQKLQDTLAPLGFFYAPDPASQKVSSFGGNVGENSGGPHCLRYGVTTDHVLGLQMVMPDGQIVEWGGKALDQPGYDLLGIMVGSEGILGIVTRITVRILPNPEGIKTLLAIYSDLEAAGQTVSDIIASGIIPATLEIMDRVVIKAVEQKHHAGYPLDAEAVLIIELEGYPKELEEMSDRVVEICRNNRVDRIRVAKDEDERQRLWAGRRGAFGAVARLKPSYLVCDGTVPRAKLPETLRRVKEIGKRHRLLIGNVFHAGDGNLHPLILFDDQDHDERERVFRAGHEILEACVEAGGTISGEHGIGTEKLSDMDLLFSNEEIDFMRGVKDVFDPSKICNPGKLLPEINQ